MKAKIEKVEFKSEFDSQYGKIYSFLVIYNSGKKGYYNSKNKEQTKFKEGQEVDIEETVKTSKDGNQFTVIKPVQQNSYPAAKQKNSLDAYPSFAVSYIKDLIVAGKIPLSDFEKESERIFKHLLELHKKL